MRQGRKISAYGICRDDSNNLLLVGGSRGSNFPGSWNLPGGEVVHGESPTDALVRAFDEETGLAIEVGAAVDVRSDVVRVPDSDQLTQVDRILFEVTVAGGSLRSEIDGGTGGARFFAPAELADAPLMPWLARMLGYATDPPLDAATLAAATPVVRGPEQVRFQRFAAYGVVHDPAGRLLLTRIAQGYPGAGHWHLPGGGTDFGESAREGLVREIREETGQAAAVGRLLDVRSMHNPRAYGPERRALDWHSVRAIFDVTVPDPTTPVVHDTGGSTDGVGWFTYAEARRLKLNRLAQVVLDDHLT